MVRPLRAVLRAANPGSFLSSALLVKLHCVPAGNTTATLPDAAPRSPSEADDWVTVMATFLAAPLESV
jgi:hypothetical protein